MLKQFEQAAAKYKRNSHYQFCRHENHAEHHIYSQKFIAQKIDYIHQNPVRAGIVHNPEDYIYSSVTNYANLVSVLKVQL